MENKNDLSAANELERLINKNCDDEELQISLTYDSCLSETEDNKTVRVFYLCNGEKEECKNKYGYKNKYCYKNGGECEHTSDVRCARNFKKFKSNESVIYEEMKQKTIHKAKRQQEKEKSLKLKE